MAEVKGKVRGVRLETENKRERDRCNLLREMVAINFAHDNRDTIEMPRRKNALFHFEALIFFFIPALFFPIFQKLEHDHVFGLGRRKLV